MKPNSPKTQRCAIYTRKSTEHNLDLAFNSLDAHIKQLLAVTAVCYSNAAAK